MDTNQKHPLQVIYESMLEDPSYYNGDWVAKYLTFVKETVPEMMKKEVSSDEDVDWIVKNRNNPIASYGPTGRHTKKVKNILKANELHIFFKNYNDMLQEVNIHSNNEFIYSDNVYYRLYKNINNEINNIKGDSIFFLDDKGKPYSIINRMLSAVFPQYLGPVLKLENFRDTIDRTNEFLKKSGTNDIINTGKSWLDCNKNFFDYCKKHIKLIEDENKEYHISLLLDYLHRKNINQLMEIYKMKNQNIILNDTIDLLQQTKNLILTGAPGTGKTYLAKQIADKLTNNDNECVSMVQFHPSYDYTDFVEGLRPIDNGNGEIGFERKDGTFKEFCKKAISKKDEKYVFIIDEINRGEISKIFGELFFAIDPGYRGENGRIKTQYQNLIKETNDPFKEGFFVPENVYIIGTMNDIDRSVDSFDFAMRRRFRFVEIRAKSTQKMLDTLSDTNIRTEAKKRMDKLNEAIKNTEGLNENYQIGASYFLNLKDMDFNQLWEDFIAPLLQEYVRGLYDEKGIMQRFAGVYGNSASDEGVTDESNEN